MLAFAAQTFAPVPTPPWPRRPRGQAGMPVLPSNKHHGPRRRHEVRLIDPVALLFFQHLLFDVAGQLVVTRAVAQERAQVVVVLAEEAGAQLAVRGNANPRAES